MTNTTPLDGSWCCFQADGTNYYDLRIFPGAHSMALFLQENNDYHYKVKFLKHGEELKV